MPDAGKANTTLRVSTVRTSGGEHSSTCELATLFKTLDEAVMTSTVHTVTAVAAT
jgi:hypothetical protein